MEDAYYVADGDRFVSTEWTQGPWGAGLQHAGPVSALAGRAVEGLPSDGPMRVARFTLEIFRPVPIAPLTVDARLVRPGKRVQFAEAVVSAGEVELCRASAWRVRAGEDEAPEITEGSPPPGPDGIEPMAAPETGGGKHYIHSIELRFAHGAFFEPTPAAAWARMRVPLVAGEEPSALARVLVFADSGNGISMMLPWDRYLFINTEVTVHLVREPRDEWVCMDAVTRIDPAGVGLAESTLWDRFGRIGGGRQALFVARR